MAGSRALDEEQRRAAFAEHVVPEIKVLLRVARTLVGRPADAEDLVQDTLLRAYRAVDRFDGRHPRAWLLTILRNTNINRNRRRRPSLLADPEVSADRVADPGAGPEEITVGSAFDTVVSDALSDLPIKFRQVVDLVDLAGLSYSEAAEALGVPLGTVMSRLHRARKRIRDQLADSGLAPKGSVG